MNRAVDQPEPNPLREGLSARAVPQPCTFVIFGASGDLTHRKLIPALYNLACADMLPTEFKVVGFAVTPMDDGSFRKAMRKGVEESKEANPFEAKVWDAFEKNMFYITADFLSP